MDADSDLEGDFGSTLIKSFAALKGKLNQLILAIVSFDPVLPELQNPASWLSSLTSLSRATPSYS